MKGKTFGEWRVIAEATRKLDLEIRDMPRPIRVGDRTTPEGIETMTMGQMLTLSSCKDDWSMFYAVCHELLDMDSRETDAAYAPQVVMFVGWAIHEIERMNELFKGIKTTKTAEEKRAGCEKLDFGAFGLVDWYAKRMGIHDHEEVMNVPCLRVYQCLKMDAERDEYEKRLAKILREKK